MIPVIAYQQIFSGMLLGDHDFFFYNVTRFLYPALAALVYAACLVFDAFSVETALIANGAAMAVALAISVYRSLRRHGLTRPDTALLRHTFKYGVKAHAGSTAGLVNARLDLIVIPAFLSAASVGLYSIATNVTSIITTLTGTVALMALPIAARERGAPRPILVTLQTALGIRWCWRYRLRSSPRSCSASSTGASSRAPPRRCACCCRGPCSAPASTSSPPACSPPTGR